MQAGDVVARRFEVERFAGAGAMGLVFRARDLETGDPVALKVLVHGSAERFLREARILAEVAHPHIVRYIDHGHTASNEAYLAMEWLEGVDLSQRLLASPLALVETLAMARATAGALAAAHARGVVHRDVKPSNLFLVEGDPSSVRVLDFGAARFVRTTSVPTASGIVLGTPGYLAPEQIHDEHGVDARADAFALGCVLFECLTGRPAFVAQHVLALLGKILREHPPRLREIMPGVPRELDDLVAAMLAKNPADRPADMAAIGEALAGIEERMRRGLAPDIGGRLVFRWWGGADADHFYTTEASGERALQCGYTYEGVGFQLLREGTPGTVPLYRWYSRESSEHFYTSDPSGERAPATGYQAEGVLGPIATAQLPGTVPLHRWWNGSCADHFYTTDPGGELAPRLGYEYEGVVGYVVRAEGALPYAAYGSTDGTTPDGSTAPSATGGVPISGGKAAEAEARADAEEGAARGGRTWLVAEACGGPIVAENALATRVSDAPSPPDGR